MTNALTAILTFVLILFIGSLIGTAVGALGGWIVGLFYTNTIQTVLTAFGVGVVKVWQLGAFLGFVGGFFRTIPATGAK